MYEWECHFLFGNMSSIKRNDNAVIPDEGHTLEKVEDYAKKNHTHFYFTTFALFFTQFYFGASLVYLHQLDAIKSCITRKKMCE